MNKTKLLAAVLALTAAMSVVSCEKRNSGSQDSVSDNTVSEQAVENEIGDIEEISEDSADEATVEKAEESVAEETQPSTEQVMVADENAVPASGAAPVLSVSSVTGAPGETVDVTVSLSGADKQWAMCGVHMTYDERLTCIADESDTKTPIFTKGEAVNNITGFITMLQVDGDRNEYLIEQKQNAVFFAAVDSVDNGADGDIVTFSFKIPDDAQSGTVYDFGFYYREGDMFLGADKDESLQDYAFSHWQGGSVTVA